jgi:DNA-binding NarL/FixJ family response regulator
MDNGFSGNKMVRILVATGDDTSRERLRSLLNRHVGWRVCAEASTGREAVEMALALTPEVVILDLALCEVNGLAAARQIKRGSPDSEILILTAHETDDLIRDVLIAGARACLPKANASLHLAAAVDSLSRHRPYLSPKMAHTVLNYFVDGKDEPAPTPSRLLTARERQILQLLAEGRTNGEISKLLSIAVKTVETHRATLMRKLGVSSLAELVRYAIRNSIIEGG